MALRNILLEASQTDHRLCCQFLETTPVQSFFKDWFNPDYFVCQSVASPCKDYCGKAENRCGSAYWRKHCAIVARMMENLALERGESSNMRKMWHAAGLLHDLDYLKAPHDQYGRFVGESHPLPLAVMLQDKGFPPFLILAILEHSPHLELSMSSQMSAALIGCDEAATLAAFGDDLDTIKGVPSAVIAAIPRREVSSLATGKRRHNIRERMLAAFDKLNSPKSSFPVFS
jgi:putative nucleotidyltransferase with HDIG domain